MSQLDFRETHFYHVFCSTISVQIIIHWKSNSQSNQTRNQI